MSIFTKNFLSIQNSEIAREVKDKGFFKAACKAF